MRMTQSMSGQVGSYLWGYVSHVTENKEYRIKDIVVFLHSIMKKYIVIGVQSNIVSSQSTALHCMCKNAQEKKGNQS